MCSGLSSCASFPSPALLPVAVALLIGSIITRNLMIDLMPNYAAKNGEIFLFTLSHLDGLFIGAVARMLYDMPAWERRLRAFSTTAPLWAGLILAGLLIDYLIGSWNTANWGKAIDTAFWLCSIRPVVCRAHVRWHL